MYAFYFDSSSCSGCKACQTACKDKHGLEVGRLWRRVYEVSGGEWRREGAAWLPDVYAYNLSISCNHCQQPTCVPACPAQALYQRPDGLVWIYTERCLGCQYCTWACPYDALQYDHQQGVMTKCTGCVDNLEMGLPPACVAACPLRALDFGEPSAMQNLYSANGAGGLVAAVAPLPEEQITHPGLLIRPHSAAERAVQGAPRLANLEEVHTAQAHDERPLVLFTVLAQMAVGAFITLGLYEFWAGVGSAFPILAVMMAMGGALLLSLWHLGRPQRAYRALANWRTSWLSREILSAGAFFAGTALSGLLHWLYPSRYLELVGESFGPVFLPLHSPVFFLTALAGLALLVSMVGIYRLRAAPVWDHWRTPVSFFATCLLLGPLLAAALLYMDSLPVIDLFFNAGKATALFETGRAAALAALLAALVQAVLSRYDHNHNGRTYKLRLGLLTATMLLAGVVLVTLSQPWDDQSWMLGGALLSIAFVLALASDMLGRWSFYQLRTPGKIG